MDETGGHYAKWTKSEKDKYHMISIRRNLKKGTQSKKMIAKAWRVGEMRDF